MRKKLLTLLLTLILVCGFSMSAMAATTYKNVKTSGGSNGWIMVEFRCTCVQETISTNYSWTSSITPPYGITGLSYKQSGAITLSNHTQKTFSEKKATFSYATQDALIGGRADMSTSSSAFGSASASLSVTR